MIIREAIYGALWILGSSAGEFASANRRLRHWSDVAPAEQPALFMSEKGGHAVDQGIGSADRMDALRRFLHIRPFKRSLCGAGDDLEPTARCARASAGTVASHGNPKPRATADGSARLHRRQNRDRRGGSRRPGDRHRTGRNSVCLRRRKLSTCCPHYRSAPWMTSTATIELPARAVDQLIEHWWEDHFPGSAVARDAIAWNVAHAAKETLKRLLVAGPAPARRESRGQRFAREYLRCNLASARVRYGASAPM